MSTLRAYTVVDPDADEDMNACLVFAKNKRDARMCGANELDVPTEHHQSLDINRTPDADKWRNPARKSRYVCSIDEACVAAGLKPEGWDYCCECGELTNNWDACEARCVECEHDTGAPETPL